MTRTLFLMLSLVGCGAPTNPSTYLSSEGFVHVQVEGERFTAQRDGAWCSGTVRTGLVQAHTYLCGSAAIVPFCTGADATSCVQRARKLLAEDPDGSQAALTTACAHGHTPACVGFDDADDDQLTRGAAALVLGCARASGNSCMRLGYLAHVNGEPTAASVLSDRACALGSKQGCANAEFLREEQPATAVARL